MTPLEQLFKRLLEDVYVQITPVPGTDDGSMWLLVDGMVQISKEEAQIVEEL